MDIISARIKKNSICDGVKRILKQIQFTSKLFDSAFDKTVCIKKFLMQITSTLDKLKKLIDDLLTLCNRTLEKVSFLSIIIDEIQSTNILSSRDPSVT